ncbi:MAG: hypothetical protein ABSC23_15440 [Bryobacteraceae bacterium]|jgi:hypothetical protein
MRYWAYFAGKLAAAAALLYGALNVINGIWPVEQNPPPIAPLRDASKLLPYNLLLLGWVALGAGAAVLIVRDQRRRCRTCLRRLRMPVETGSWSGMLLSGRPRIESICPYGHGTLKEEESQTSALENPEWTPRAGGLWEELCASSKEFDKHS